MFTKKKEAKYNEEIALLKHELEDLRQIVKTQELLRLRTENANYKEREQALSHIQIHLKSCFFAEEENKIVVKYEMPTIKLSLDAEGDVVRNETFYAINFLRLLSIDDMKMVQNTLNEVKKSINPRK